VVGLTRAHCNGNDNFSAARRCHCYVLTETFMEGPCARALQWQL
jgi:hypothetical protein